MCLPGFICKLIIMLKVPYTLLKKINTVNQERLECYLYTPVVLFQAFSVWPYFVCLQRK